MTVVSRLLCAFLPFGLAVSSPAAAQTAAPTQTGAEETPRYAQPDDPWIYRGTDIPIDREWLFGELPNGLRYAVRYNGVPPGQVSIRVRIDAGSLHERDDELGFAHLVEHLTFRESQYFGNGEAIPHFQRLGASLGNDTNAVTSPTQTVYQLDLPNARPEVLDESMRLFSGMIREPALSAANLRTEVPIVLAERRESAGPQMRISQAMRNTIFTGQRLAERDPIGTAETLEAATSEAVKAFHRRWYRPENAVIVVAGDADPQQLALMVEKYFGDWEVSGEPAQEPDFGDPVPPEGAEGPLPVGAAQVLVEPSQPRGLTYAIMRPWEQVTDNLEYNRLILINAVAEAIINRRLESRARAGGNYLYAGISRDKPSRSADATFVTLAPLTEDWKAALTDVRSVIADALASPPSQQEIDRELAEFDVSFANSAQQQEIQAGSQLADSIVTAVDIREAVASPATVLNVFRNMRDRFTPEAILQSTRQMFAGDVVRAVMMTPEPGEADAAELRTAIAQDAGIGDYARTTAQQVAIDELPLVGEPQQPVAVESIGQLFGRDVQRQTYANGVRALLWRTDNEPGRVTVRVRFGGGWRSFADDEGVYAALGQMALVSSGLGELGQEELDALATGRKLTFDFDIEEGTFTFEGITRAEDVADQLYLFAEKLAEPRWDAAPVERARSSALLAYNSYGGSPNGVLARDLEWLLHNRDPRFETPSPETLREATPEKFREVWSRVLAEGPVEVAVFGDIDTEAMTDELSRTFGALPAREPLPPEVEARGTGFPEANDEPLVRHHGGDENQAAAVIAWPTGGGSDRLPESRKLELLASLFSNRLLDALRERTGSSYSPYVASDWPLDAPEGGNIVALAQMTPEQVPAFFAAADSIVADLAQNGPTADELARATEPVRQLVTRMQTGHTYWLNLLEGAAFDPNRLMYMPTRLTDYTDTTPEEIKALAQRYLADHGGWRLEILPDDGGSGAD